MWIFFFFPNYPHINYLRITKNLKNLLILRFIAQQLFFWPFLPFWSTLNGCLNCFKCINWYKFCIVVCIYKVEKFEINLIYETKVIKKKNNSWVTLTPPPPMLTGKLTLSNLIFQLLFWILLLLLYWPGLISVSLTLVKCLIKFNSNNSNTISKNIICPPKMPN